MERVQIHVRLKDLEIRESKDKLSSVIVWHMHDQHGNDMHTTGETAVTFDKPIKLTKKDAKNAVLYKWHHGWTINNVQYTTDEVLLTVLSGLPKPFTSIK